MTDTASRASRTGRATERDPAAAAPCSPLVSLLKSLGVDAGDHECLAPLVGPAPAEPTFTVVVRTQARRPQSLREALKSLSRQTWAAFDVVVTVHAGPEAVASVQTMVSTATTSAEAPPNCRVLPVAVGGTRARPLNAGLDAATGDYVVFLDDDDLAEPRWLSVFARSAGDAAGRIIRARTARQPWATEGTREPQRPRGPVDHIYPATFDLLAHFSYSETPICSIALPRLALAHFGLRFDESLPVCEDWDLLIRSALLLGVHCVDETTSLYRRSDSANSVSQVDQDEWAAQRLKVIDKLASQPFVLDGPSARRLADAHFDYGGPPHRRAADMSVAELLVVAATRPLPRSLKRWWRLRRLGHRA